MAIVRKTPFKRIECKTFAWRYYNWYDAELEAAKMSIELPVGYQYELRFPE